MDFVVEEADGYTKLVGIEIPFCGTRWMISEVPSDHPKLDGDDGLTEFDTQNILINEELHSHRKNLTVVHELMHVVCDSVGIEDDEELIRRLEHGILELVKKLPEEYKNETR